MVETWPFERGRAYNRREDIHARYAGQQQGGIITPQGHSLVIMITGEEGEQHGYSDTLRPDGVFEYFGEGQLGDMQMRVGNLAIATHSQRGKSLLLFRKLSRSGGLRYEGEWVCEGVLERQAPDREGKLRRAYVFELRALDSVEAALAQESLRDVPIVELRERAFAAARPRVSSSIASRTTFERSRDVRNYVLARAGSGCEGCSAPAPFCRADGSPYLEPHHIRRVSDGGPDDPRFVIALCPNCHRRVHAGADGETYNAELLARMARVEPASAPI